LDPAPRIFRSGEFDLAFIDAGEAGGEPVLLIHGFASTHVVNWVAPSWTGFLGEAGYRVVAFDNRGHGLSSKSHDPRDYAPELMAGDAAALLDHLGIPHAHVMGYSMGARIAAFLALGKPGQVATLVMGGLGLGAVQGVGEWDEIAAALLAEDPAAVPPGRPEMFRRFADQTRSDRLALAACIETSRKLLTAEDMGRIRQPTLVGVGTRDDLAGSAEALAALMPDAEAFAILNRDHMLAVGDRSWKARVLQFLRDHRLPA
jgi:pimeloyl-ACP methyl ester carboxylesterase